jgi:ribA/ribD-fused uncharacterized protein
MEGVYLRKEFFYSQYIFFDNKDSIFGRLHNADFIINGIKFTTVEHYIYAAKAKFFGDREMFNFLTTSNHKIKYKRLNKPLNYDAKTWDDVRFDIAFEGVRNKFEQNPSLKSAFLELPKDYEFALLGAFDKKWATGMEITNPQIMDRRKWTGHNIYGRVINFYKHNVFN